MLPVPHPTEATIPVSHEALLDPRAFPRPADHVETLETHISRLYFVGDRVYKVKKPVDLGFLDFRALDDRRHYCEEELRLNRRLSPDVYLGVLPIVAVGDGAVRVGGDGEPLDWCVEMRRLPADRMLDRLLAAGEIDNELCRGLATLLARFHGGAATGEGVDEHGSFAAVSANTLDNFAHCRAFAGRVFPARAFDRLEAWTAARLDELRDLIEARVRAGHVREGHGDLHAGNVCVLRGVDGHPSFRVYDCIEFTPRFRCADVACDLAFLLMDLDLRRYRGFSGWLEHAYVEAAGDRELRALLPFYKAYRAMVRAKVAALRSAQCEGGLREACEAEALRYFLLATSYALPPVLVLCCGLPGSGKSSAAGEVAAPFEARVLESDRVRKRQHGLAPGERSGSGVGEGIYVASASDATYAELLALATESLDEHRSVVVDAGLRTRDRRRPFLALGRARRVPTVLVWLDPPERVVLERLAARERRGGSVSEAGPEVWHALRAGFEPPEAGEGALCVADHGVAAPLALATRVVDELCAALLPAPLRTSSRTPGRPGGSRC
ncbi:MAG: AAA family ATPase [Planctomycetota bacterium]